MTELSSGFQLIPEFRDYVWGGQRLRPDVGRTAEAWVVYEHNRIRGGELDGQTLGEVAARFPADLLGERAVQRTGSRFPLLIKLLDCAEWLSLQVHPNDAQAVQLEGPGHFGKTEAWHIIEADPDAMLMGGLQPGVTPDEMAKAIRGGKTLLNKMQRHNVQAGDSISIPAGMIHALGPGLLIYEVQQTSDITYRVYDWDRPASAGRKVHIEQSLAVSNPSAAGQVLPARPLADGEERVLVRSPYFELTLLHSAQKTIARDTHCESFHALTVIEGSAIVRGAGWQLALSRFETVLVPAAAGAYQVAPLSGARLLCSSVPDSE